MTLLLGAASTGGKSTPLSFALPVILVVLYGWRGSMLLKGDEGAATSLIQLHAIGAIVALIQVFSSEGVSVMIVGFKVLINIFGAITAYTARQSIRRAAADSFAR